MRLFVAIRPSPAVRDVLLDAEAALRRQGRGTFTRPENLHLTLAFLGEAESAAPAQAALEAACTGGAVWDILMTSGGRVSGRMRAWRLWPWGCRTPCGRRAIPWSGGPGGPTSPWCAGGGDRSPT